MRRNGLLVWILAVSYLPLPGRMHNVVVPSIRQFLLVGQGKGVSLDVSARAVDGPFSLR